MANTIRINVTVSEEVHQFYKDRSEKTGVSMSALMFLALETQMREEILRMKKYEK